MEPSPVLERSLSEGDEARSDRPITATRPKNAMNLWSQVRGEEQENSSQLALRRRSMSPQFGSHSYSKLLQVHESYPGSVNDDLGRDWISSPRGRSQQFEPRFWVPTSPSRSPPSQRQPLPSPPPVYPTYNQSRGLRQREGYTRRQFERTGFTPSDVTYNPTHEELMGRYHVKAPVVNMEACAPQNITTHIELELFDDPEDALEYYCKMRRLGRFKEAAEHFEEHLQCFNDNRYVLVQHGQCLIEAGRFDLYAKLEEKWAFDFPTSGGNDAATDALDINWLWLAVYASLQRPRGMRPLHDIARLKALSDFAWEDCLESFNSTEVQSLLTALSTGWYRKSDDELAVLYRCLVDQKRIWEAHDLIEELQRHSSPADILGVLRRASESSTELDRVHVLHELRKEWERPDESTLFALISIFSSLALHYMSEGGWSSEVETCLQLAEQPFKTLLNADQQNLRSRPCLRFLIARMLYSKYEAVRSSSMEDLCKENKAWAFLFRRGVFPHLTMPRYFPTEKQIWQLRNVTKSSEELKILDTVFEIAEELGDVHMQASCLVLGIGLDTQSVHSRIAKLEQLWKMVGNQSRQQEILLFRYILSNDEAAEDELRRDILLQGELGFPKQEADHIRFRVLFELERDPNVKDLYWAQLESRNRNFGKQVPAPQRTDDMKGFRAATVTDHPESDSDSELSAEWKDSSAVSRSGSSDSGDRTTEGENPARLGVLIERQYSRSRERRSPRSPVPLSAKLQVT